MANVSIAKMAGLFRRMATSYRAGVDLLGILRQESGHGSAAYRREIRAILEHISTGESLASGFAVRKNAFPALVITIVEAGERGGRLEESFDRLASHYESLVKFRRRLLTLMGWPMFELCFSICILGLLIVIMEWIAQTSGRDSIDWLGFGKNAKGENRVSTGAYLMLYMGTVFFGFASVVVLVMGTARGWFGTFPMQIARRIPLLGKIIVQMAMARFAWTLGIAIDAGISAMHSAQMALRATENFFYSRHEESVGLRIRDGEEIHQAIRETKEFPEEVVMFIENGETAGEIPEMMGHLSKTMEERAENNLRALAMVGFVLTFLFVAFIIIVAIFYLVINFILGPIQEVQNSLNLLGWIWP